MFSRHPGFKREVTVSHKKAKKLHLDNFHHRATVSGLSIGTRCCVCNRCIVFVIGMAGPAAETELV